MSTAPVLAIIDEHEPYNLKYDACGYGSGAALMQDTQPIAFFSHEWISAECYYPIGEPKSVGSGLKSRVVI